MELGEFWVSRADIRWMNDAACDWNAKDLFFSNDEQDKREALSYCAVCPVVDECLEYALTHKIEKGIWGGTIQRERKRILRRRRGRDVQ